MLKGSLTEINLLKAFTSKSQARNRYSFFAKVAKEEGHPIIEQVFEQTAEYERILAKRFFKLLPGGNLAITEIFSAGYIGNTIENLNLSVQEEKNDWEKFYPAYAMTAKAEGLDTISQIFDAMIEADKYHYERFVMIRRRLQKGEFYKRSKKSRWRCRKCGFIHLGTQAPQVCLACAHPRGYFDVVDEPAIL